MVQTADNKATGLKRNVWVSWAAVAAVAIVMGLLLPQLMPGDPVGEKSEAKTDAKGKGKLEYTAPALPDAPSPIAMFTRLGAGTGIVLGLCVATLYGFRRWMYPTAANGSTPRDMRLMETLQLGNRCALHLVHLGKQPVLVGVDGAGIKTIVPLPTAFEDVLTDAAGLPAAEEPVSFPKLAA